MNSRNQIPVISLFSGAGSMDLGFRKSGFLPVLAIDSDAAAVETYNKNFKSKIATVGDLSALNGDDVVRLLEKTTPGVRPRGVIGGPPCQSFSVSNVHRKRNDPRGRLVLHYAKILKELNKKYLLDFFVFENVEGLRGTWNKKKFRKFRAAFQDAGFNIYDIEETEASARAGYTPAQQLAALVERTEELVATLPATFGSRFLFDAAMIQSLSESWSSTVKLPGMIIPKPARVWAVHGAAISEGRDNGQRLFFMMIPGADDLTDVDLRTYAFMCHELAHVILFKDDSAFRERFQAELETHLRRIRLTQRQTRALQGFARKARWIK